MGRGPSKTRIVIRIAIDQSYSMLAIRLGSRPMEPLQQLELTGSSLISMLLKDRPKIRFNAIPPCKKNLIDTNPSQLRFIYKIRCSRLFVEHQLVAGLRRDRR